MTLRIDLNTIGDSQTAQEPSSLESIVTEPFRLRIYRPPTPEELLEMEKDRQYIGFLISSLPREVVSGASDLMAVLKSPAEKNQCPGEIRKFLQACGRYQGAMAELAEKIEKDFISYKAAVIEIWEVAICQTNGIDWARSVAGKWKANRIAEDLFDSFDTLATSKKKCEAILSNQNLYLGPFDAALITANSPGRGISLNTKL